MIRIQLSKILGEKRLTQADVARMTGIRASTINDLYHEIATRISLEHLDLLCEALNCDISDIIAREPNIELSIKTRSGSTISNRK